MSKKLRKKSNLISEAEWIVLAEIMPEIPNQISLARVDYNNNQIKPKSEHKRKKKELINGLENVPKLQLYVGAKHSVFHFEITHLLTPSNFYIAPLDTKEAYRKLSEDLFAFYADFKVDKTYKFIMLDKFCVVRLDDKFLRALVTQKPMFGEVPSIFTTFKVNVEVFCIDTGKRKSVSPRYIYPFQERFGILPPRCINCKLDLVKTVYNDENTWSLKAIKTFRQSLKNFEYFSGSFLGIDLKYNKITCDLNKTYYLIIHSGFFLSGDDEGSKSEILSEKDICLTYKLMQTGDCAYNTVPIRYVYDYVVEENKLSETRGLLESLDLKSKGEKEVESLRDDKNKPKERAYIVRPILNTTEEEALLQKQKRRPKYDDSNFLRKFAIENCLRLKTEDDVGEVL